MAQESSPTPNPPPRLRDLELDAITLGPTTRMLRLEADGDGNVVYQGGKRRVCMIPLPRQYASAPLLVIDSVRWAMLMEPTGKRLEALFFPVGTLGRTILMGASWGQWINEHGDLKRAVSIPELLLQWDFPVAIHDARQTLGIEFPVNIFNREVFTQNALTSFRDGPFIHSLELQYAYPLGGFRLARVKAEHERTARIDSCTELSGFPIIVTEAPAPPPKPAVVPGKPAAPAPAEAPKPAASVQSGASPKPAPAPAEKKAAESAPRVAPATTARQTAPPPRAATPPAGAGLGREGQKAAYGQPGPARTAPPPQAASPKAPAPPTPAAAGGATTPAGRPLPRTEQLPMGELLTLLSTEGDLERRWRMIEANLILGRYERSYPLIARHHDLISERAALWAPARHKVVFSSLPGTVLIGMMTEWAVNQVLAIAEGNPESEKIMEWLREREVERMMKLNLTQEPTTIESARKVLGMDKHYDEATVRKVWRTLLGFMNADHGRSEERAIHRKKDEIAKILQAARNVLLNLML